MKWQFIPDRHVRQRFDVVALAVSNMWPVVEKAAADMEWKENKVRFYGVFINVMMMQQKHILGTGHADLKDWSADRFFRASVEHYRLGQILPHLWERLGELHDPAFQLAILDMLMHHADDQIYFLLTEKRKGK